MKKPRKIKIRRTWARKPQTQVKPSGKRYSRRRDKKTAVRKALEE